jgi:hypothetical protein
MVQYSYCLEVLVSQEALLSTALLILTNWTNWWDFRIGLLSVSTYETLDTIIIHHSIQSVFWNVNTSWIHKLYTTGILKESQKWINMNVQEKFHIYKAGKLECLLNERHTTDSNISFDLATENETLRNK